MQPDKFPLNDVQWEQSVTFRVHQKVHKRQQSQAGQDVLEIVPSIAEDRSDVPKRTPLLVSTLHHVHAAGTRKPRRKRAVKYSYPARRSSLTHPAPRQVHVDAASSLVNYLERPPLPLQPDHEGLDLHLPTLLPGALVRRYLHHAPTVLAQMVSKAGMGANHGRIFANSLMSSVSERPAQLHAMIFAMIAQDRVLREITYSDATELMVVIEHIHGLIKMLEIIGGLHEIKTPGVAATISWAGIMSAVRTLYKPIFPFIPHTTTFVAENGRLAVTEHERKAVAKELGWLGAGFWHVWSDAVPRPVYLYQLMEVICDICDFTVVVENHASGRLSSKSWSEIIDQRNFVQYKLMCLESLAEVETKNITVASAMDLQYEGCRLACIIYSFIVVFPVPPVEGPFETLVERLKSVLQVVDWRLLELSRLRLHVWILVMGATASLGLPDRPLFLIILKEVLEQINVPTWKDLKMLLRTFLWHPRTSNPDGLDIWRAIDDKSRSIQ